MTGEPRSTPRELPQAKERVAASLLVRCWLESPDNEDEEPILRGYVRNLKTGEESFIKDLESVGQQIRRQLTAGETTDETRQDEAPSRSSARQESRT